MLIGLPRIYGTWHMVMCGHLQHAGLAENVLDHRLNSRTVYMNPISRYIYWNMNYHVEHHMFPMVPYHALPRLHELIKNDLPAPNTSILDGYQRDHTVAAAAASKSGILPPARIAADRAALPRGIPQSACGAARGLTKRTALERTTAKRSTERDIYSAACGCAACASPAPGGSCLTIK